MHKRVRVQHYYCFLYCGQNYYDDGGGGDDDGDWRHQLDERVQFVAIDYVYGYCCYSNCCVNLSGVNFDDIEETHVCGCSVAAEGANFLSHVS